MKHATPAGIVSATDRLADLTGAIHEGVDELRGLAPMFPSPLATSAHASAVTMLRSSPLRPSAGPAPTRVPAPPRVRASAPARRLDTAGALALLREAASEGDRRAKRALSALAEDGTEKTPEKKDDDETPDVEDIKNGLRKLIKDPDTSERDRDNARRALKELGGDVIEDDKDEDKNARSRAMGMRNRAEETPADETGWERSKRELQKTIDGDGSDEEKDAAKKALEVLEAHEQRQKEADRRDEERRDVGRRELEKEVEENQERQERQRSDRAARAVYGRLTADEKAVLARLDSREPVHKRAVQRGASLQMPTLTQADAKALVKELEAEMRGGR